MKSGCKVLRAAFLALAEHHNVMLVGGNLAHGPLSITVTVHGFVPLGKALTRKGARPGDHVFVTGYLGDASAGLQMLQAGADVRGTDTCVRRFCFPEPRIRAGMSLRGIASAAIDVSDGLMADLGHVLEMSGVGARIDVARLPLSPSLLAHYSRERVQRLALGGGDDYELCFTLPPEHMALLESCKDALGCSVTQLGQIVTGNTLRCVREDGTDWSLYVTGYKHFQ